MAEFEFRRSRQAAGWLRRNGLVTYGASLAVLVATPAIQFFTFLLTGRALGLEAFGTLTLFQSTIAVFVELAGVGMSEVLIRDVARSRESYPAALYRLIVIAVFSSILAVALNAASQAYLTKSNGVWLLAAAFGAIEIPGQRVLIAWEHIGMAHRNFRFANAARILPSLVRLACTLVVLGLIGPTIENIILGFLTGTFLSSILLTAVGVRLFGPPKRVEISGSILVGLPFALNQTLRAVQGNIDRLVVSVFFPAGSLAIYVTAVKFWQLAMLPISAVLRMAYPRIFSNGQDSKAALSRFSLRLAAVVLFSALLMASGLFAIAGLLPMVMGPDYLASAPLLRLVSFALVPAAMAYVGADILVGLDRAYWRVGLLTGSVLLQSAALFVLCPLIGLPGAVAALYISSTVFAAASWCVSIWILNRK
jgi:O-antigen/teichoic acid export membrane protein